MGAFEGKKKTKNRQLSREVSLQLT